LRNLDPTESGINQNSQFNTLFAILALTDH
jgi:hypothetical protein